MSSITISLSNVGQITKDNTWVEQETCKFGRYLRQNSKKWYTWCFLQYLFYDAYDPVLMADDKTINQIVVILFTGTQTPLF